MLLCNVSVTRTVTRHIRLMVTGAFVALHRLILKPSLEGILKHQNQPY